jgi:hypothetical protein
MFVREVKTTYHREPAGDVEHMRVFGIGVDQ